MELPSPAIFWVNPSPSRVINRTIFFCNALESHECACCMLAFLYFDWLFPLLARETSSGNRSTYTSTQVDSKGLCGRGRLHLTGSWQSILLQRFSKVLVVGWSRDDVYISLRSMSKKILNTHKSSSTCSGFGILYPWWSKFAIFMPSIRGYGEPPSKKQKNG